jgi:hypothetical protein
VSAIADTALRCERLIKGVFSDRQDGYAEEQLAKDDISVIAFYARLDQLAGVQTRRSNSIVLLYPTRAAQMKCTRPLAVDGERLEGGAF